MSENGIRDYPQPRGFVGRIRTARARVQKVNGATPIGRGQPERPGPPGRVTQHIPTPTLEVSPAFMAQ